MIKSKADLKEYVQSDNNWLLPKGAKQRFISRYANYPVGKLKKFLYYLRKQEYYINTHKENKLAGIMSIYYERKKNRLGNKLGIEIPPNCFSKGLNVYHIGSIIVNPKAKIGENCSLHGMNCIGNNGLTDTAPTIGDNVDIGVGAVIIGDVTIADNIKIGANAVVNRSFTEPGCTIAGVPAKIVKRNEVEK